MTTDEFKQHAFDFLKGFIGAMAAAAGIAATQYLGAHLPEIISFFVLWAGGIIGVKART